MTPDEIEALLRATQGRGLARFEYSKDGFRLAFAAGAPAGEHRSAARPPAPAEAILSPCVGFFRRRHPAGWAAPNEGEAVAPDTVVAFVQAGPLLQPVPAARAGRLGAALLPDGAGVGFGTPLFALL